MAIIRYEERVRKERADGTRKPDTCPENNCGCSVYGGDEVYAGMTFQQIAETPLRTNQVCPHPKVVVPVTGAFVVEEPVNVLKPEYKDPTYRLVDGNPCDGRMVGVLETIADNQHSVPVKQAHSVEITEDVVEDTAFDEPTKKRSVRRNIKTDDTATQPVAVDATSAEDTPTSNVDGK